VEQRDGAIELRRDLGPAGRREVNGTQLFSRRALGMCVLLRVRGERGESEKNRRGNS
jgi:hypothetical protein